MHKFIISLIVFASFALVSCNNDHSTPVTTELEEPIDSSKMVTFKGRTIDLEPYVQGFPYSSFNPYYAAGKLYYKKTGETTDLMELSLDGNPDLSKGKKIGDIDYSKRNVWSTRYNKNDKHLYWNGDEINDEVMNVWRMNTETGVAEQLTEAPYTFGYSWNEEGTMLSYIARLGVNENRLGELRVLDLSSKEEKVICQDTKAFRFTWGSPSWNPNNEGAVLTVLKDAHRSWGNLMYVDFETGATELLLDPETGRGFAYAFDEWLNEDEFLFYNNEDGFSNIYKYNISKKEQSQVTKFTREVASAEVVELDGEKFLFVSTSDPIETDLYLINITNGEIINQQKSDLEVGVYDVEGNKMIVSVSSNTSMFRIDEMTVTKDGFSFQTMIDVPQELRNQIYQTEVERITYPTFDIDPNTGKAREIHAYLYKPKNPLPADQSIVMIQSFYGGGNYFSIGTQVLAEAGIYVLSPAPRGSDGFGKDFFQLNDKDLGGNEIIDVIYAAKYISEKLNIPPSRVGIYGGSHGGYATMRALTFPGEINGNEASFDWGFGLSHAGFSDIIDFYESCNIPDWVILEAGDPATEEEKLNDRSPLYHADKMTGKLLLTHGTNDSRVPIAGSRMMADSLNKFGKDVTLVEFEGQGHSIKGLNNNVIFYQTRFDFLEEIK